MYNYDILTGYFPGEGEDSVANYFATNWFNIESKWTNIGRRHLVTLGNTTTNRLER